MDKVSSNMCTKKDPQGFMLFPASLVATNKYPVENSSFLECDTEV